MIDNLSIGEILVDRNRRTAVVILDVDFDSSTVLAAEYTDSDETQPYRLDWHELAELPENAARNGR